MASVFSIGDDDEGMICFLIHVLFVYYTVYYITSILVWLLIWLYENST